MTQENLRQKNYVDRVVQGTLLLHIVGHWLLFVLTAGIFLFFVEMMSGDPLNVWESLKHRHGPTLFVAAILGPLFLYDLCKLSNRFAGPMVRLRRSMQALAEGREVTPLQFREGDFWKDLATSFNCIAERVQSTNGPPGSAETLEPCGCDESPLQVSPLELSAR